MKQVENKCAFLIIQTLCIKSTHCLLTLFLMNIFKDFESAMTLDLLSRYAFDSAKNVQQKCALPGPKYCMPLQRLIQSTNTPRS